MQNLKTSWEGHMIQETTFKTDPQRRYAISNHIWFNNHEYNHCVIIVSLLNLITSLDLLIMGYENVFFVGVNYNAIVFSSRWFTMSILYELYVDSSMLINILSLEHYLLHIISKLDIHSRLPNVGIFPYYRKYRPL